MTGMVPLLLVAAASISSSTGDGQPLDIVSDGMTLSPDAHVVTATGHVFAKGEKFDVHCDSGDTTYAEEGHKRHIRTMLLHGHVHIRRFSDGMVADSQEATYDAQKSLVVLTGDPVVTRGADTMKGVRIEVSTDDNTVDVSDPRVELVRPHKDTVHVTAEKLRISNDGRNMRFEHNVHVTQPRFASRSEALDAIVEPSASPGEASEVKRLVFTGHVKAERQNQTGTCGKAIYDVAKDDLLMEEHPVVIQEGNTLRGRVITINNTTGVATVEGADVDIPPEHQE